MWPDDGDDDIGIGIEYDDIDDENDVEIEDVAYQAEAADDGWIGDVGDIVAGITALDPYTPVDAMNDLASWGAGEIDDAQETATSAAAAVWGRVGEMAARVPYIAAIGAASGLGTATVGLAAGTVVIGGTIYVLGYAPNVAKLIDTLNPAKALGKLI